LIGIIIVKELILVDKDVGVRVGDLKLRSAPQLKSDTRLYDMLRLFETGRCHLAVLVQAPGKPVVAGRHLHSFIPLYRSQYFYTYI